MPSHWVLPDGCSTLSFRIPQRSLALRTPSLAPFRAPAYPGQQSFGVRFRPGALARFAPGQMRDLLSRDFGRFPAQEGTRILQDVLHRMVPSANESDARVDRVVRLIRTDRGRISVCELAEQVNVSERQLERLCLRTLHLSPKEFARATRLQAAIRWIVMHPNDSLTQAAAECDYADQAHMGREFKALGQLNPTAYIHMLKDYRFRLNQPPDAMSDLF